MRLKKSMCQSTGYGKTQLNESKHNKVQIINDINFKNRTPNIMSFCHDY